MNVSPELGYSLGEDEGTIKRWDDYVLYLNKSGLIIYVPYRKGGKNIEVGTYLSRYIGAQISWYLMAVLVYMITLTDTV